MSTPKDGGPAFPALGPNYPYSENGMSLRDWFAGQALAGFIAASANRNILAKLEASMCYQMADAMLAAREARK